MADQEKVARDLAREVLTRHLAELGPEDIAFLDPAREFDALPPSADLEPADLEPAAQLAPAQAPAAETGIFFPAGQPENGRTDRPDG
jgi:hypothetical protein